VKVLAERIHFGETAYQLICKVLGVGCSEPDARNSGLGPDAPKKIDEVDVFVEPPAVRINVLTKQKYFADAGLIQEPDFFQDFIGRPAPLRTPHVRDYAVGAIIVAALHYRNRGRYACLRQDFAAIELRAATFLVGQAGNPATAFLHPLEHLPDRIHRPCAYDHIKVVEPVEQFFAELLGHAAPGYDFEVWFCFFEAAQGSQKRVDLLFRLPAHRTGVEKDNVSLAYIIDRHVSQVGEQPLDPQRIIFIHLAAKRSDV
jgi:hypothetical protein